MADEAVSLRQFAAMQGWNPGHAHRLKVAGRLVLVQGPSGRELVHVERSLQRIAETSNPQKGYLVEINAQRRAAAAQAQSNAPAAGEAAPPAAAPDPAAPAELPARNVAYNEARTTREAYEAKLARIKYEREVGKLVDVEQVRAEFGKKVATVRDQLLRLPERVAPMLLSQGDLAIIKRTLDAEIRAALIEFAGVA